MFDGAEKTPLPVLTRGAATLVQGRDYAVPYSGNVRAGTATVLPTGMGNYCGAKTVQFVIEPRDYEGRSVPGSP